MVQMIIAGKILKYGIVFGGLVVTSEILWKFYKSTVLKKKYTINEVLFTNNKSGCCQTIRSKSAVPKCSNKYCISNNLSRIKQIISSAKNNVYISMYIFTCQDIADAILKAHERGLEVHVIADKSMAFSSGSQLSKFSASGIPVRFQSKAEMLMHHKFCLLDTNVFNKNKQTTGNVHTDYNSELIDLPVGGVVMTGSMNWTMQALSGNWDNFVITSNQELVNHFKCEFATIWDGFNSTT